MPELLDYGTSPHRVTRRLLLGVIAGVLLGMGWTAHHGRYDADVWRRVRQLYWQRRVTADVVYPHTLAFDRVIADRLATTTYPYIGPFTEFHGGCGGVPSLSWGCLAAVLPSTAANGTIIAPSGPTLFVGRLRSAAGDRLVRVSLDSELYAMTADVEFGVTIVTPATLGSAPVATVTVAHLYYAQSSQVTVGVAACTPAEFEFRSIDCGIRNPGDPARFTCDYTAASGRRHGIEGTLSADGRAVFLAYIAVPDAAGTRPSIATPAVGH